MQTQRITWKLKWEKLHRERNFTIIMVITMVFSDVLGFLSLTDPPSLRWNGSIMYTCNVCWVRLPSSAPFKHLTTYHKGGLEVNIRLWIKLGESPSFSASLRPTVDAVDLFLSRNYWVQMEIWLIDKDTCNSHLFLITTWTAWSLNWMETTGQRFWKWSRVARLLGAEWTRGMISRRSETDHYICSFCFLLFGGGRDSPSGAMGSWGLW